MRVSKSQPFSHCVPSIVLKWTRVGTLPAVTSTVQHHETHIATISSTKSTGLWSLLWTLFCAFDQQGNSCLWYVTVYYRIFRGIKSTGQTRTLSALRVHPQTSLFEPMSPFSLKLGKKATEKTARDHPFSVVVA